MTEMLGSFRKTPYICIHITIYRLNDLTFTDLRRITVRTTNYDSDRTQHHFTLPTRRQGGLPMGGTDPSTDDLLAGTEDVVRRRRGKGYGTGNFHPRVAEHQKLRPTEDLIDLDLDHRLAPLYRQIETNPSYRRPAR